MYLTRLYMEIQMYVLSDTKMLRNTNARTLTRGVLHTTSFLIRPSPHSQQKIIPDITYQGTVVPARSGATGSRGSSTGVGMLYYLLLLSRLCHYQSIQGHLPDPSPCLGYLRSEHLAGDGWSFLSRQRPNVTPSSLSYSYRSVVPFLCALLLQQDP